MFGGTSQFTSVPPTPPPYLTSLMSGLAGLTSSTSPELSAQVNSVISHRRRKQWPCTNSRSVNRKWEVWKDKVCKLDIHKGPAGSRPRFRNNFPVALSSHAGREQSICRRTSQVPLKIYLSPCVFRSSWWMYSIDTDITKIFPLQPVHTFKASYFCIVFSKGWPRHGRVRRVSSSGTTTHTVHVLMISIISPVWKELTIILCIWFKIGTRSIAFCGQNSLHSNKRTTWPWLNKSAHQKKRSQIVAKMFTMNYRAKQVFFFPLQEVVFRPISLLQLS